jgi:hypothetical protein
MAGEQAPHGTDCAAFVRNNLLMIAAVINGAGSAAGLHAAPFFLTAAHWWAAVLLFMLHCVSHKHIRLRRAYKCR